MLGVHPHHQKQEIHIKNLPTVFSIFVLRKPVTAKKCGMQFNYHLDSSFNLIVCSVSPTKHCMSAWFFSQAAPHLACPSAFDDPALPQIACLVD